MTPTADRTRVRRTYLAVMAVVALVMLAMPSLAIGANEAIAQPADASPSLQEHLSGSSEGEPAICDGFDVPHREVLPGTDNTGAIDVKPAATEVSGLEPGGRYRYCFKVHNRQAESRRYRVRPVELAGSPDPSQQLLVIEDVVALGSWMEPSLDTFTLEPGEQIVVPWTLQVPEDVPAGSLAAAFRITQEQDEGESAKGARVIPSLLQRIYVTFPGGRDRSLDVSDVRAPRVLSRDRRELTYTARFTVHNDGTVVDTFHTRFAVRGIGRTLARSTTPPATLLPDSATRVAVEWDDVPWIGVYTPRATVISNGQRVEVELPRVIVLPPRPYVIGLVVALVVPFLLVAVRRRRRRTSDGHDEPQPLEE